MISALLVLALHGCGSGETPDDSGATPQPRATAVGVAAGTGQGEPAAKDDVAAVAAGAKPLAAGSFVAAVTTKKQKGDRPGVLLLVPDAQAGQAEASALARKGIAALALAVGPVGDRAAFDEELARARSALKALGRQPGVDRRSLGVIGQGPGGHVAAVLAGREPTLATIVLDDPDDTLAETERSLEPVRWLERAGYAPVLLQITREDGALDEDERNAIVARAPFGTEERIHQGRKAVVAERAVWLADKLR